MIIQLIYPYFCYQHFNIPSVTYCKFSIFPVFIMKKCICFILLICSCTCCTSTNNLRSVKIQATNVPLYDSLPHNIEGAYLHLPNNRFDFGKINRKKIPNIPIEVEFSNIGTVPLVILKADVSCGCLSVEYPKAPILPNQTGKLIIKADLRAQYGTFNKAVFIKTNAENDVVVLRVAGEIR